MELSEIGESPRESSFCAHVILSDQVMVVPDSVADSRFIHNIQVTGQPHIRFYAGAPLKAPDGQNLGSFCIIDTVPRHFTAEQQVMLAILAEMMVDEMELRRTARELHESEAALRQSLRENSELAVAVSSLTSGVTITNPNLPDNPIIFANPGFLVLTESVALV
jgi:GAF domain-containing protein